MTNSNKRYIVGVMGPGAKCSDSIAHTAFELGALIAKQGWIVLSGGRDFGVMDAVSHGAKSEGGLTVGILPNKDSSISSAIDIPIITDINFARNNINVVSSNIVVSCGMGVGTSSEISLGLNAEKHVIMLLAGKTAIDFYLELRPNLVHVAESPSQVIEMILKLKEK